MHELSLCQNIIDQLQDLAQQHGAVAVARVEVQVGVLSGVEAQLLEQAFPFAAADTIAADARLVTEVVQPRVACAACGQESAASASDLRCPACGSEQTRLVRGRELILARVELVPARAAATAGQGS